MLQSLILIDALSSACWEKQKERKKHLEGFFFPKDRHTNNEQIEKEYMETIHLQ
jgi:hypothetical protein